MEIRHIANFFFGTLNYALTYFEGVNLLFKKAYKQRRDNVKFTWMVSDKSIDCLGPHKEPVGSCNM